MSDDTKRRFWEGANHGIIGLAPGPWKLDDSFGWPTDGYDSVLTSHDWAAMRAGDVFGSSGQSRDEWLVLADEMIRRWTEWRAFIASAPPNASPPGIPAP